MSMKRAVRSTFILVCVLGLSLPAFGQSTEAPTVVMVFRHAEPVMPAMGQERDPNPSLNEAGQQRAEALIETVAEASVTAIFSSQLKRTQETVAPLPHRRHHRGDGVPPCRTGDAGDGAGA